MLLLSALSLTLEFVQVCRVIDTGFSENLELVLVRPQGEMFTAPFAVDIARASPASLASLPVSQFSGSVDGVTMERCWAGPGSKLITSKRLRIIVREQNAGTIGMQPEPTFGTRDANGFGTAADVDALPVQRDELVHALEQLRVMSKSKPWEVSMKPPEMITSRLHPTEGAALSQVQEKRSIRAAPPWEPVPTNCVQS